MLEERTAEEVAEIFTAAGSSVSVINTDKREDQTDEHFKDKIKRNVAHLELIKGYKKVDGTTSIWTTEDFTEIDAAITKGKTLY